MSTKILIVDDEASSRDLLEGILRGAGYATTQANDGPAALARIAAAAPDLVLLDLRMPGLSGLEVCDTLKRNPATQGIPVIVVTGLQEVTHKEAALMRGADDFLTKPVDSENLLSRVSALLKVRSIHQELQRTLAYLHEVETDQHARRSDRLTRLLQGALPSTPPSPTAPSVLLVDDENLARTFYGDLIAEHGYHVHTASTGAEALSKLRSHAMEAVILDVLMPGMSGLEVLERIHVEDPELPVIMLTVDTRSQTVSAALKLGALDFIVKGMESDLLVLAVHRAVRHRRELLAKQREIGTLRARIAELEAERPKS